MLRIVGLERNENCQNEFVLLQNQGNLRVQLRGHALLADCTIESGTRCQHVFADDALIPAGMYVMVTTGIGEAKWAKTKDGALVFHAYMNRTEPIWTTLPGQIHILAIQHSYAERPIENVLKV